MAGDGELYEHTCGAHDDGARKAGQIIGGCYADITHMPGALQKQCGFVHIGIERFGLLGHDIVAAGRTLPWAHCGPDLKKALTGAGVFYCYIDDFYSGNAEDIKLGAIFKELNRYIEKTVRLNINDMLNEALRSARVEMGTEERKRFIAQYIRPMRMSINDTGDMVLELKRWK